MILFLVGVVEMLIVTLWTRSVAKASVALTGTITGINIFIWYYVISQVVQNLDNWSAIIPYAAGCVCGSMLGVMEWKAIRTRASKAFAKIRRVPPTAAVKAERQYP